MGHSSGNGLGNPHDLGFFDVPSQRARTTPLTVLVLAVLAVNIAVARRPRGRVCAAAVAGAGWSSLTPALFAAPSRRSWGRQLGPVVASCSGSSDSLSLAVGGPYFDIAHIITATASEEARGYHCRNALGSGVGTVAIPLFSPRDGSQQMAGERNTRRKPKTTVATARRRVALIDGFGPNLAPFVAAGELAAAAAAALATAAAPMDLV